MANGQDNTRTLIEWLRHDLEALRQSTRAEIDRLEAVNREHGHKIAGILQLLEFDRRRNPPAPMWQYAFVIAIAVMLGIVIAYIARGGL